MNKKPIYTLLVLLMIPILLSTLAPASAWNYTDTGDEDDKYEEFGPRADRLLIKLFADAEGEWDALEAGEIDITDWPLTEPYYDRFTTPPQNESIETKYYGAEQGIFLLDINWNNNPYLGNPQDPAYPNPLYPNPTSCVNMRQALWHLTDRETWGPICLGEGFYYPLQTVVPPCFGPFSKPMANPYPYDPAAAIAKLESDVCPADGAPDFPLDDGTGHRYWDLNGNGVYDDPEEYLELRFFIRSDHYHRTAWGSALVLELEAINVRVDPIYGPVSLAMLKWYLNKEVHLYTGAWSLGVDPDFLWIWHSDYYWHPGVCYNTGYVNDAILDDAADHVRYANTMDEALTYSFIFQDRFAEVAAAVPWWSYAGSKAVRRRYTGGSNEVAQGDDEDPYRGNWWDGIVNIPGYGCDNYWSFLNMHPRGYEVGDGEHMTIRYGLSTPSLSNYGLNPLYATREHDWKILGLIYDTLLKRNPYNTAELMPGIAKDYEVGVYTHPVYGLCTRVTFTMRDDVMWMDGTPLTTADVEFTLLELGDILEARGFPPPWWWNNIKDILDFKMLDAYNFQVLFDVKSVYAAGWLADQIDLGYHKWPWGTPILPKHIWKPIAEDGNPDEFAPDPNMIGSGPWRFVEYVGYSHIVMEDNAPGSTVTTSNPGSTPITSPGFFRFHPFEHSFQEIGGRHKWSPGENITAIQHVTNLYANDTIDAEVELYFNQSLDDVENDVVTPDYSWNDITLMPKEKKHFLDIEGSFWAVGFSYTHYKGHVEDPEDPHWCTFRHDRVKILLIHSQGFNWTWDGESFLWSPWCEWWLVIIRVKHYLKNGWKELPCTFSKLDIEIYWKTIEEDICGSTWYDDSEELVRPMISAMRPELDNFDFGSYPYKTQLPTPDCKVDIKDVATAAKAFGSYPGHIRWRKEADITCDSQIDIKDIAAIAKKFGWVCG